MEEPYKTGLDKLYNKVLMGISLTPNEISYVGRAWRDSKKQGLGELIDKCEGIIRMEISLEKQKSLMEGVKKPRIGKDVAELALEIILEAYLEARKKLGLRPYEEREIRELKKHNWEGLKTLFDIISS